MIKAYYQLTKPGMIYGNIIVMTGGFLLASRGNIDLWLLLATLAGLSLVIASGCVFNNYIDRDFDKKMERTRERALVRGTISGRNALIFGTVLGVLGALILGFYTNPLALELAGFGFFAYVVLYSLWTKHYSVYSTIVGSFAGAMPPVVGYCAVSNHFDLGAIILFTILVLWQMPHFFSIAIYRLGDYTTASIPVLPVRSGVRTAKIHTLLYVIALTLVLPLLTVFDYTGYAYGAVMTALMITWLVLALQGFRTHDDVKWARKMFMFSLVVNLSFAVMIALDAAK